MIDYKKIADYIHDYADEMNTHNNIDAEVRLHLLIGYIYGIMETAYVIRKMENEQEKNNGTENVCL